MVKIVTISGVFCYDLDAPVGQGKGGSIVDCEFVRFGLLCVRKYALARGRGSNPAYSDFLLATVGMSGNGGLDGAVIRAITGFQKSQGLKTDGFVSPLNGTLFGASGKRLTMSYLQEIMRVEVDKDYPRIDKDPASGATLSLTVQKMFHVSNSAMKMEII